MGTKEPDPSPLPESSPHRVRRNPDIHAEPADVRMGIDLPDGGIAETIERAEEVPVETHTRSSPWSLLTASCLIAPPGGPVRPKSIETFPTTCDEMSSIEITASNRFSLLKVGSHRSCGEW